MILDVHSHNPQEPHAIISGTPEQISRWLEERPDGLYSVGIHPWDTEGMTSEDLARELAALERLAADKRIAGIGETGLDSLRGAPLDLQRRVFIHHVELSERLAKPVVLHVVRQQDAIVQLRHTLHPTQPWIWHGYRGAPERAAMILEADPNQYISFGRRFNPLTPSSIPLDRILMESDAMPGEATDTRPILEALAASTGLAPDNVLRILTANASRAFNL